MTNHRDNQWPLVASNRFFCGVTERRDGPSNRPNGKELPDQRPSAAIWRKNHPVRHNNHPVRAYRVRIEAPDAPNSFVRDPVGG